MDLKTTTKTVRRYEPQMNTYFENVICKRPLYIGGAYTFVVRVSCVDKTMDYAVYSPFKGAKCFSDFAEAKEYFTSLGK